VYAQNSGYALSLGGVDQSTMQHPGCRPDCFAGSDFFSQSAANAGPHDFPFSGLPATKPSALSLGLQL
jgi:hypothetical protein